MGTYLNPGNSGFAGIRNDIYIDKSGLISLVNETIETPRRLTCVSRPRRFGKSLRRRCYAPIMINAAILRDCLMIWRLRKIRTSTEVTGSI